MDLKYKNIKSALYRPVWVDKATLVAQINNLVAIDFKYYKIKNS